MSDPRTIGVYDARADEYGALTDAHNRADRRLTAFISACPPGGRVLDLGCGPGMAAAAMAEAGLQVDAIDASGEMARRAARHPDVTAWQADFDSLNEAATYDGIWANFSLLHAPRTDFPRHLAAIHRALRPRGAFWIGMKLGEGEGTDRLGRHYTYYSAQALEDHITAAGFSVLTRVFGNGAGLDGTRSDWVSVAARA